MKITTISLRGLLLLLVLIAGTSNVISSEGYGCFPQDQYCNCDSECEKNQICITPETSLEKKKGCENFDVLINKARRNGFEGYCVERSMFIPLANHTKYIKDGTTLCPNKQETFIEKIIPKCENKTSIEYLPNPNSTNCSGVGRIAESKLSKMYFHYFLQITSAILLSYLIVITIKYRSYKRRYFELKEKRSYARELFERNN